MSMMKTSMWKMILMTTWRSHRLSNSFKIPSLPSKTALRNSTSSAHPTCERSAWSRKLYWYLPPCRKSSSLTASIRTQIRITVRIKLTWDNTTALRPAWKKDVETQNRQVLIRSKSIRCLQYSQGISSSSRKLGHSCTRPQQTTRSWC
jgi:hypothetical protein